MSHTEHLIGLTSMIKRVAYHYVQRGIGTHSLSDHPHYNKIVVRELYEFMENPVVEGEHSGGVVVEFYKDDRRIRWVEFRCQVTGGGGDTVIRRVK